MFQYLFLSIQLTDCLEDKREDYQNCSYAQMLI